MPAYAWTCHVCGAANAAGLDTCTPCASPSRLSAVEIARRRRGLGLDRSAEPSPGWLRTLLPRRRIWLPGLYVLATGMAALFALFCGGDMCTLFLAVALLPWTLLASAVIPFSMQNALPGLSYLFLAVGFISNVALLHLVGRGIDRWRTPRST